MGKCMMKYVLAAEAAACVAFCFLQIRFSGIFTEAAAFPFEQVGWGLRRLSLSGGAGNVAAVILYVLFSLIPMGVWLFLKRRRKLLKADLALPGLAALLFIVNYYMVNPGLFASRVPGTGKWMLGCTFYSVLLGYLVIRFLAVYREVDAGKLQRGLRGLLWFLAAVLVYAIFGQRLGDALEAFRGLPGTGGGMPDAFMPEGEGMGFAFAFLALRYIVNILPYGFDLGIIFYAVRLLAALEDDRYSEESVALVARLATFCRRALEATVAADAVFNILQCLFCGRLDKTDIVIHIPVLSVVFVLAALLLAQYLREDQKLKQEQDLII